jgi:hypothetical protein
VIAAEGKWLFTKIVIPTGRFASFTGISLAKAVAESKIAHDTKIRFFIIKILDVNNIVDFPVIAWNIFDRCKIMMQNCREMEL